MKIAISAETTIDLTKELLEKYEIHTTPFTILLGEKTYLDGEISTDEIIESVLKTGVLPKTSAINEYQFTEHFDKLISDGYDHIIHFSISSEMSSAYANAKSAANKYKGKVHVVDSRVLSTGIALLAIYASKLVKEKVNFKELIEKVEKRVPYVQTSFVLERLDYLYKGGRCSSLAYFGANLLKLKPQIIVKNGKMESAKKYRGTTENVVRKYCEDVLLEFNTPDKEEVFITYTTATEEMIENAKQVLQNYGFKNINVTRAGGTITSHCGEHCLGILYINDGK